MFEPTAGRIQLDINSLLVNIYTDRYVERGNIHCVRPLGRMHAILVIYVVIETCNTIVHTPEYISRSTEFITIQSIATMYGPNTIKKSCIQDS